MSVANLCSWLFLLGLAPFAFCFACLLDGETQIWLGDLRVAFWLVVFVSCSGFYDLPRYMTTCVHVEFISKCFFTCKDRALERDRPYRRQKKSWHAQHLEHVMVKFRGKRSTWSTLCLLLCGQRSIFSS